MMPIGLGRRQIEALSRAFPPRDRQLWGDIELLADQFWASGCDPLRGHHLLMAVGNFKRQAIIRFDDPLPTTTVKVGVERDLDRCEIGGRVLIRDGHDSWEKFCGTNGGVSGFGVATTTTLLSALWPRHHVIIDQRALRAFIGLRLAQGWECLLPGAGLPSPTSLVEARWGDYHSEGDSSYLKQILAAHDDTLAPVEVERALFELDKRHKDSNISVDCRDWESYGRHLLRLAEDAAAA